MDAATEFSTHRGPLFGLAYRMLGSAADAEDVLQEAFLRWWGADRSAIAAPRPWLTTVVANLCLNHLASARMRREHYVGPWLPEPVCTEGGELDAPAERAQRAESASLAVLVLLEQLTPAERAAFVLHEAFGYDHASIADVLGVSPANSRQLCRRAVQRVQRARQARFDVDQRSWRRLVERFLAAARGGDLAELERLLAEDAVSWSDGGGTASAARHPVVGRDRVSRLVVGLARKADEHSFELREINGVPGLVVSGGGEVVAVVVPDGSGSRISALRAITNPDKLRFLQRQLADPAQPDPSHDEELSGPT